MMPITDLNINKNKIKNSEETTWLSSILKLNAIVIKKLLIMAETIKVSKLLKGSISHFLSG